MDFGYDPDPVLPGEQGAGTFPCPSCGTCGWCDCPPAPSRRDRFITSATTLAADPARHHEVVPVEDLLLVVRPFAAHGRELTLDCSTPRGGHSCMYQKVHPEDVAKVAGLIFDSVAAQVESGL